MRGIISDFSAVHILGAGRFGRAAVRPRRRRGVIFFVCFLVVAAVVFGVVLYRPFTISQGKKELYLLSLYRTSLEKDAQECAASISDAGGAGYVFNNGDFLAVAFCYKRKGDAEAVRSRMLDTYADAAVTALKFERVKVKRWGDRAAEKRLKNLLGYPFELMEEITSMVYSLDTFESTESGALLAAEGLKKTLSGKLEEAKSIEASSGSVAAAVKLSDFLEGALEKLTEAATLSSGGQRLSGRLKRFVCATACDYHSAWQIMVGK